MSYGTPLDKAKVLPLVETSNKGKNQKWNEMLELNRMAFSDKLPKYSESRCIAISFMLIKKNAPQIKWILSFSDSTQCGDGTIYRASGFKLTAIKENENTCKLPDGSVIHKMTLETSPLQKRSELGGQSYYDITKGKYNFKTYVDFVKGQVLKGYQLRYIYIIDKKARINVEILPFSEIDKVGAGMYKGKSISLAERKEKQASEA